MESPLAIFQAMKLAKENKATYDRLEARRLEREKAARAAEGELERAHRRAFDDFLVPFATAFSALKNVDLGDLPLLDSVPELKRMDVKTRMSGLKAVETLTALAGSAGAGAAAGGITFAAVGTFAAASTGTAISTLSGAAATSATLAWLGGGSLAAGGAGVAGGTMVLASAVAVPALALFAGFIWWKGAKELRKQLEVAEQLKQARHELSTMLTKASLAIRRTKDIAGVITRLVDVAAPQLLKFQAFVETNSDFRSYPTPERERVAELAALATTLSALIAAPVVDKGGHLARESRESLAAAKALEERWVPEGSA